jgi:hypothetical protein
MKAKLPEGVLVFIGECNWVYDGKGEGGLTEIPNGSAMTYADRLERDKAIARAAFDAAYKTIALPANQYFAGKDNRAYKTADDYLNSPEFLELSGAKSLSELVK